MLTIFPLSQANMIGFTLDGTVDAAGLEKFMMAVEAKVLTHGKIRLLGNVKDVGGFQSFQTFWNSLKNKKNLWDKIEKYAILTDHSWLSALTGNLEWLTPGIEIKTFQLSEGELAHQWLKLDPLPKPEGGLRQVDLGRSDILGIAFIGKALPGDYEQLNQWIIDASVKSGGRVKLLVEIVDASFSGQGLVEDIKASVKHYSRIERMAFIGGQSWLKTTIKLGDILTPGVDLAAFGTSERNRAIAWLS